MRYTILPILALFLLNCTGTIYTVKNPSFDNGQTEGVLFYGYQVVEKKVLLDRIRNLKTGEITHSMYEIPGTSKYCAPNIITKKVVEPDFSTVYAIKYDPAIFETIKFSVELDNGTLKSVNSESTPGHKTAVEALQGVVSISENILGGFIKASDASSLKTLSVIEGKTTQATPIKCSTNE